MRSAFWSGWTSLEADFDCSRRRPDFGGSVDWDLVQSRLIELCGATPALFGDDVDRTLRVENPGARNSLNFFWPAHSSKPYRGSVLLEISSSGFRLFWVDQPCLAAQDVAREWARAAMSVVQISACLARAIGAGPAFQVSARWRAFDAEKALAELSLSSEGLDSYPREQAFLNAIQGQLEGMALSATKLWPGRSCRPGIELNFDT